MAYNKNVLKARASVGKQNEQNDVPSPPRAEAGAQRRIDVAYLGWSPNMRGRMKAVYSLLLNRGPQTVPQLREWLKINGSGVSKLMNGMKDIGVVRAERAEAAADGRRSNAPMVYSAVVDSPVPSEWLTPSGGLDPEVLHACDTYDASRSASKGASYRKRHSGQVEFMSESVIAQSMASSKRVDADDVGPYEDLVIALASISLEASNAEIKGWLRELTGLAERRIREAKVKCPACGAVLETYKVTGLRCPRCRAEADGGTTEVSLAMLGALVRLKEGSA